MTKQKRCPECGKTFSGKGWEGIDAHWKSQLENLMPYRKAWPLIKNGKYGGFFKNKVSKSPNREQILRAMKAYDQGIRQEGRGTARSWFVHGEDGRKYPAKHIWGLATGFRYFQTHSNTEISGATVGLTKQGFNVFDIRETPTEADTTYWVNQMARNIKKTTKYSNGQRITQTRKNKNLDLSGVELLEHLDELMIKQSAICALTGIALNLSPNSGDDQLRPSPDRIDSSGHYSRGNLQIVCKFANFWKKSQENREFKRLLNLVRNKKSKS